MRKPNRREMAREVADRKKRAAEARNQGARAMLEMNRGSMIAMNGGRPLLLGETPDGDRHEGCMAQPCMAPFKMPGGDNGNDPF